MSKLALFGGPPVMAGIKFPPHPNIGEEEKRAVMEVLSSGQLSSFIAARGKHFLGGTKVREFEKNYADEHGCKYAVAFNSATAALHAAVVAVGVSPCEEVIVPPYTFTSTATSVLMHNAIPVFADIQEDIFCIDPKSIEDRVTSLTKAIMPVHLFGHVADMDEIMKVAKKHNLKVIEDCAQAPNALYKGKKAGTIGDCGIFSFTENKNITTGEGGMLITNDFAIAAAARLVRNHGEAVWDGQQERTYTSTMLGWNYRMTEIQAALGVVQFKKLDMLNDVRINLSQILTEGLKNIDGLEAPVVYDDCKHVYYVYAIKYDEDKIGIPRDLFVKALNAEGVPFGAGYIKPLYLSPMYHENKHYAYKHYKGSASYNRGLCPVAERMHEKEVIMTLLPRYPASSNDMNKILLAINKVLDNKHEFKAQ